jgi:PAS domain S-box-containing protein
MSKTVNPIRVLHVDDEPDLSDMVATFLEREDDRLTVCTATSANEGLETIDEADVDCIVSDYDMPSTNGIEFLEAVRESHPELPFILYTGKGSEEVAADAISAGVTDYLQKDRGTEQYAILANRIRNAVSAQWSAIESEQNRYRLERILKTIPSCVVQLDYEGRFIFANDRAVEVLGLEESELTDWAYNDPEWEIMDLNGNPISDEKLPFRQVRDSGEPLYGFRHTIKWSDGTQKNLLVNGTPLLDSNGETDSVIFSLTDITDQIEYQHQLTQATARLEALFENSPDMINIHDMEGNITDPNPLLCEEMGYDEDELTDMKVWELDQEMNPHKAHTLWEGMNQGDRKRIEGVYQRRDGSELPVEVHIRYLYVDGEDRFMVISRDITERKKQEQQLQQERDRFRAVFEEAFDTMVLADEDGQYIKVNKSATELFRHPEDELIGRSIREFAPEDFDFEMAWQEFQQSEKELGTFPLVRPNGDERIIEYAATRDIIPDQHLSVLRDVTERKKQEQQLQQERDRFRAVFEEAFDTMVLADEDGQYIKVNKSATELFRHPEDELIGRSIREFAPEDFDFEMAWQEFQQSEKELGTFPLVRPNGDERIIEYAATRDIIPDQHLSVLRDVTERKQREQKLNRQNEQLDEFASLVSHDLRNPLNVASGHLEIARKDCDSEHLEPVKRALDRMNTLTEDLLMLARQGETIDDLEPVDIAVLVEGCWQNVETADATLVIDVNRTIYTDKSRLKQLVENLVRNAVEHGGDAVTVTVGELDDGFYIEDNGPGIPEHEHDDVFDAGYSTNKEGTGFGLSIVKQIVNAHDWEIHVAEGSEGGARFEISSVKFNPE